MRTLCKCIGLSSIMVTFVLPFAYFIGLISLEMMKQGLLIATVLWFATSVFWIGKKAPVNLDGDPLL